MNEKFAVHKNNLLNIVINNKKKNINNKGNKGFTLVEMLVTFVVLGILLSLSVRGLLSWQDWSRFNKQNEYAQTIFVAAQNQLAGYVTDGTIKEFDTKLKVGDSYKYALNLNTNDSTKVLCNSNGEKYTLTGVWTESENAKDQSRYQGNICYLMCYPGDYEAYINGGETKGPGAKLLFEFISDYVYDAEILNACICVEFSPEAGQVFAVCYSDNAEKFEYNNNNTNKKGTLNIANRTEGFRRDRFIGYYGVDTLTLATSTKKQKPVLANIHLNNAETLNLSFKVNKVPAALRDMTYDINVYDEETKTTLLKITLDGRKILNRTDVTGNQIWDTVSCPVTVYSDDNGTKTESTDNYEMITWVGDDGNIHLVLDAVDVQATTELYAQEADTLAAYNAEGNSVTKPAFASTYSLHRFGIDANKIKCSVQGYGAAYKTTTKKNSKESANPFFANSSAINKNEKIDETEYDTVLHYDIANARHLYNIRYVEDVENDILKKVDTDIKNASSYAVSYKITNDIDWTSFVLDSNYYNSKKSGSGLVVPDRVATKTYDNKASMPNDTDYNIYNYDFPSIKQLKIGNLIDGNKKIISGLTMSELMNGTSGVYGYKEQNSLSLGSKLAGKTKAKASIETNGSVGLFVTNNGCIYNLSLDNIIAVGSKKVGAFCGTNTNMNIHDLKTLDTAHNGRISGEIYVGGIIGYQTGMDDNSFASSSQGKTKDNPYMFENMENNVKVEGRKYVGGILGQIKLTQDLYVKIYKCNNYGAIAAVEDAKRDVARYLGGIVGYCSNLYVEDNGSRTPDRVVIDSCISSPEYNNDALIASLTDNDKTDEEIKALLSEKLNGVYVGGIAGYNNYGNIVNCSTEAREGVTGYIFGYEYVGGIVGFNRGPASGIIGGSSDELEASNGNKVLRGTNYANVIGDSFVGGITGCNSDILKDNEDDKQENEVKLDTEIIEPDKDTNYNVKISNWENRGIVYACDKYAGGITGYNTGWIFNCNSDVDRADVRGFYKETYAGDFAGGIAGYNNGIIGNTERKVEVNAEGKGTESIIDTTKIVESSQKRLSSVCYIMGNNFVGGIVGYNDKDAIVEDYTVAGGYIRGRGCFVGGYAGFNASLSLLMETDANTAGSKYTTRVILSNPNLVKGIYFVGGSIGANIIDVSNIDKSKLPDNKNIVTQIETDNFLGEVDANEGAFAGGFIGYNLLTKKQFMADGDESVYSLINAENLDSIISDSANYTQIPEKAESLSKYFISDKNDISDINMLITAEYSDKVMSNLGGVSGKLYLGGVMGYNDENTKLVISKVINITPVTANAAITVKDEKGLDKEQPVRNGSNGQYTAKTYNNKEYTYSYAGGIIGKVGKNVTIDNCSNATTGVVTTYGTYTGGICEINDNVITNCSVSHLGSNMTDYVGGICGINKKGATISNTTVNGQTVMGRNYVSCVAAENYGTISNTTVDTASIIATGIMYDGINQGVSGIIAAKNEGIIEMSQTLGDLFISSKGCYVGGIAGINAGTITKSGDLEKIVISANSVVKGNKYVGGVIGENRNSTLVAVGSNQEVAYYRNEAVVTAENGYAGGILGNNASNSSIIKCENKGSVSSTKQGDAGGITAYNSGTIKECSNYGKIFSPNGQCGGIVSVNNSIIYNCQVMVENSEESLTESEKLAFKARKNVGGIAAVNGEDSTYKDKAVISGSSVDNVLIENYSDSAANMGAFVGVNNASITLGNGNNASNCVVSVNSNDSNAGGIAGVNYANIAGATKWREISNLAPQTVVNCDIKYAGDNANIANFGGIAGINEGKISNIAVLADITGSLGSGDTGCGGIVGYNGFNTNAGTVKAEITDCTYNGNMSGMGAADNILNIGGIAGQNSYNSKIEGCRLGGYIEATEPTTINVYNSYDSKNKKYNYSTCYSYTGGIAGANRGEILACDNYDVNNNKNNTVEVTIDTGAGMLGGVAGFNYVSGLITGYAENVDGNSEGKLTLKPLSTGNNWKLEAHAYMNDEGTGGIIGYSNSGETISFVYNYASVINDCNTANGNTSAGGIAGRVENKGSVDMRMENCENYGAISAKNGRAAGFIATLKLRGITFSYCKNYGQISTDKVSGRFCGGILADEYKVNEDIFFEHCENHGDLSGAGRVGGIFAGAESGIGYAYMSDCVNTGVISGTSPQITAGIIGNAVGSNPKKTTLYSCRNYGTTGNANEICGLSGTYTYNSSYDDYVQNCLDISGTSTASDKATPIDQIGKGKYDYYINTNSVNVDFNSSEINTEPTFAYSASKSTLNANDPVIGCDITSRSTASRKNYDLSGSPNFNMVINITPKTEDYGMEKFVIYWCNGNGSGTDRRQYNYSVKAIDSNGKTQTIQRSGVYGSSVIADSKDIIDISDFDELNNKIVRFNISDFAVYNVTSDGKTTANNYVNIRGFMWVAQGETTEKMCIEKVASKTGTVNAGVEKLTDGSYKLWFCKTDFIDNLKNDPSALSYYEDKASYVDSKSNNAISTRIPTYEEVDPRFMDYIYGKYNMYKLEKPYGLTIDTTKGDYMFKWTDMPEAYGYELRYFVYDTEEAAKSGIGTPFYKSKWAFGTSDNTDTEHNYKETGSYIIEGRSKFNLAPNPEWKGKYVRFEVRAITGEKMSSNIDTKCSEWASITTAAVVPLPDPKVHYELVADGVGTYIVAILDNADDYKEDDDTYINCTINAKFANSPNLTIKPNIGYSAKAYITNNVSINGANFDSIVYASISNSNKYTNSSTSYTETTALIGGDLIKENNYYYVASFDGFYGNNSEDLYYLIKFINVNHSTEAYVNTALGAWSDDLGTWVYGASGTSHITAESAQSAASTSKLSELPADITESKSISALSYLWYVQAYVLNYGHIVNEKVSKADIKNLKDDKKFVVATDGTVSCKSVPIYNADGSIVPGYIIYDNGDGTYKVIYSSTYEAMINGYYSSSQTYQKTYSKEGDNVDEKIVILPKPVIETSYIESDDGYAYTFKWDIDKNGVDYDNAVYNIELVGYTREDYDSATNSYKGEGVSLGTVSGCTDREYTFVDNDKTWNYSMLRLKVTRVGETDSTGKTLKFHSSDSRDFSVQLKLSQPSVPALSLTKDANGNTNKDELIYDIAWTGVINDEEHTEEVSSLGGYLISVTQNDSAIKYYYVLESGVTYDDIKTNMVKEIGSDGATMLSNYKTINVANISKLSAVLDLSDYHEKSNISVKVKAISMDASTLYRNSIYSANYEMTLPARSEAPDVTMITTDMPEYSATAYVTSDKVNEDKTFTIKDSSKVGKNGKYQIAIDIMESETSETPLVTLVSKNSGQMMTGTLANSTYKYSNSSIDFTDYAGMWLRIDLRSTADSSISSKWSDENTDEASRYKWIQIPRVILETPGEDEVTNNYFKDTKEIYVNAGGVDNKYGDFTDAVTTGVWAASVKTLQFSENIYADSYVINIANKDNSSSNGDIVTPDAVIRLEKKIVDNKTTYDVVLPGEGEGEAGSDKNIGTLSEENNIVTLDYSGVITGMTGDYEALNNKVIKSGIIYDTDNQCFKLVLPDVVSLINGEERAPVGCNNTKAVSIESCSSDSRYNSSLKRVWYRINDTDEGISVK